MNDAKTGFEFLKNEYVLNHTIATFSKPIVAILDGIVMGGGAGISVHAPFRVATENTIFAMPENSIGYFPDVGSSFFLSRLMDLPFGLYLGLTGKRIMSSDT